MELDDLRLGRMPSPRIIWRAWKGQKYIGYGSAWLARSGIIARRGGRGDLLVFFSCIADRVRDIVWNCIVDTWGVFTPGCVVVS